MATQSNLETDESYSNISIKYRIHMAMLFDTIAGEKLLKIIDIANNYNDHNSNYNNNNKWHISAN